MVTNELKGWDKVEVGAVIHPFKDGEGLRDLSKVQKENRKYTSNSSHTRSVGYWRVVKPIFHEESCIKCMNCWTFCPDSAIVSRDAKIKEVDYQHCKGCGICAEVCPSNPKSLIMFVEQADNKEELSKWPAKQKKS